ncbi:MAG: hypothetical protein KC517_02730 [Bacteroidetes bacterium]|nr:hypothetical protein [Bacteroidota bacterium]
MTKDLATIAEKLRAILTKHNNVFRVTSEKPENFEVSGTIPTMQGKKKVDGIYFASVFLNLKMYAFTSFRYTPTKN